jgi:hypothetical protein
MVTPFGFFSVGVLVDDGEHLVDPLRRFTVELGAKFTMANTASEGVDNFCLGDVRNRVPHLGEASDVGSQGLVRPLVDAVEVVLGPWMVAHGHVVVDEDPLQLVPRID